MAPFGLTFHRIAISWAGPLLRFIVKRRVNSGKEDPARFAERFGHTSHRRPPGQLIWIHAVSVGESQIALALADAFLSDHVTLNVLITTNTRTSASIVEHRTSDRLIHQYVPVDHPDWVASFIEYWRPELTVFTESELWPNLIMAAKQSGSALALVNARMNETSIKNWSRFGKSAAYLLSQFDWIGAADTRTSYGIQSLNGPAPELIGNLKLDLPAPSVDEALLVSLRRHIGDRPVVCAASTHAGEEELVCEAFKQVQSSWPDALMILVPRHPERAAEISKILDSHDLAFAQRSADDTPTSKTAVYLADTLGELALWYRLAITSLICGSFVDGIGGHNPIEASKLGSAVISGPYAASFDDVYQVYDRFGARDIARDANALSKLIGKHFSGDRPSPETGYQAIRELSGDALNSTVSALRPMIMSGTTQ
jgi:3-deoxy-D-manno-octulosonic-acid transferase